jgi:hypothetical protein
MRRFPDPDGQLWEATVGRESWGTFVILFTGPADAGVRKAILGAESMLHAQQELDSLTEQELRERLAASQPWM